MMFNSKKGMDNLYIRLVHFRNFIKLAVIYPENTDEEIAEAMSLLDELICKLDEHNDKVFNEDFLNENFEIEDVCFPIEYSDMRNDDDLVPF